MFGFRIMTAAQIAAERREASLITAHGIKKLLTPMGYERDGDYGRGMMKAVREVQLVIDDLRN